MNAGAAERDYDIADERARPGAEEHEPEISNRGNQEPAQNLPAISFHPEFNEAADGLATLRRGGL
jgi:hypothetical protein